MKNGNEARDVLGDSRKRYRARGHGDRKIPRPRCKSIRFHDSLPCPLEKKTWQCSSQFLFSKISYASTLLIPVVLFEQWKFHFLSFFLYLFICLLIHSFKLIFPFFSFSAPVPHPGTYTKTSSYESCWMVWADFEKILTIQCIRKGCQSLLLKL